MANGTQFVAEQMVHSVLLRKIIRAEAIELLSKYILPESVSSLFCDLLQIQAHLNCAFFEKDYFLLMPNGIKLLGRSTQEKSSLDQ